MQAQVNCLVTEPMANIVSGSTGAPSSIDRLPYPFARTTLPSRSDRQGQPGITLVADLGRDVGVDGRQRERLRRVARRAAWASAGT